MATMNILDLTRKYYDPRKVSSRKGGEYHSACPGCGDGGKGKKSDRFCVWPEENDGQGAYWCRQCGKGGDAIQFLRDFEGLGYKEACAQLGIETKEFRPYLGPRVKKKRSVEEWKPDPEKGPPPELWREKAGALVEWAHMNLMRIEADEGPKKMLIERGINEHAMKSGRLGWNPGKDGKDLFRPRESWGLATEIKDNEQKKRLWIPRGIVIPMIRDGEVWRIRIRREKDDPRYYVIPGSNMECMVRWEGHRAYVIVESELDAHLLANEAEDLAAPIPLGNASRKPDARTWRSLQKSAVILNALDYDAAGRDQSEWWERNLPQCKRWPVPVGKDPGEAYQAGVDLREWITAGLPKGWFL